MIGGCAVILVVDVVIGWISARLRLRLWLARSTLIVVTLVVGYLLRDAFVPECNKPKHIEPSHIKPSHIGPSHIHPRGVWGIAIGISAAPIHTG